MISSELAISIIKSLIHFPNAILMKHYFLHYSRSYHWRIIKILKANIQLLILMTMPISRGHIGIVLDIEKEYLEAEQHLDSGNIQAL